MAQPSADPVVVVVADGDDAYDSDATEDSSEDEAQELLEERLAEDLEQGRRREREKAAEDKHSPPPPGLIDGVDCPLSRPPICILIHPPH
jgi:hypothetical protein